MIGEMSYLLACLLSNNTILCRENDLQYPNGQINLFISSTTGVVKPPGTGQEDNDPLKAAFIERVYFASERLCECH